MPYGFYITDKGRELITASTNTESKVEITKACFGSGGDPETEKDYGITSLKNQFYEKKFQPGIDTYEISSTDPTELCIKTIVPSGVSGTINEIGYKDDSDNLIMYGVVREREKVAGSEAEGFQLSYENWIKVTNSDVDKIEIVVQSPEVQALSKEINNVNSTVSGLSSTVSSLEGTVTGLESSVSDLEGTVTGLESSVSDLEGTVTGLESSIESTYAKETDLQSLIQRVSALETALQGVDTLMEELI